MTSSSEVKFKLKFLLCLPHMLPNQSNKECSPYAAPKVAFDSEHPNYEQISHMNRKRLPGASSVALRYCGYDSGLDPWMDFNYELLKYLNDIKHHKPRKLNGQPPTFINHWTAGVMRLTPRDHSLLGNNEPSRQYIHLSRAEMVHNERTLVCNSHDPSPSLLYSHLPCRSSKICNEFLDLAV